MSEEHLSLYECEAIMSAIAEKADPETGEISEGDLAELVRAQTTSLATLGKLCGYMAYLKDHAELAQKGLDRLRDIKAKDEKRLASIKRFIAPFVEAERARLKRPLDVGTYKLWTTHTESVEITDDNFAENYPNESRIKIIKEPDKQAIRAYIERTGNDHPGATIQKNTNVIMK